MNHGVAHRGDALQHLQPFSDFVPDRSTIVVDFPLPVADRQQA